MDVETQIVIIIFHKAGTDFKDLQELIFLLHLCPAALVESVTLTQQPGLKTDNILYLDIHQLISIFAFHGRAVLAIIAEMGELWLAEILQEWISSSTFYLPLQGAAMDIVDSMVSMDKNVPKSQYTYF